MTVELRYPRAVLSWIPLIVAVTYAIPNEVDLCLKDSPHVCRKVNTERAIAHSKLLLNLVNNEAIYLDIGLLELNKLADFIETVDPEQDEIKYWVSENIPDISVGIPMLAAAQLLQMESLAQRIIAMDFTWQDIAWVHDCTFLPQTHNQACRTIVKTRPAYKRLVGDAKTEQQHVIVRQVAEAFVNEEAKIDLVNNGHFKCGNNVLAWAVGMGDHADAVVEMLLHVPGIVADLPKNHKPGRPTPLQQAVLNGKAVVVEMLLGVPGIEVNAGAGTQLGTALHLCVDRKGYCVRPGPDNCRMAQVLIESGADVKALDELGRTPLHLVPRYPYEPDRINIATLLLEKGALVNAQDCKGETPLHHAAVRGRQDCFDLLVESGKVDSSLTDNEGMTAHEQLQARSFWA
ncbi:Ankyrin repeat domain-containing protein [Plasmodiophora brassicae]